MFPAKTRLARLRSASASLTLRGSMSITEPLEQGTEAGQALRRQVVGQEHQLGTVAPRHLAGHVSQGRLYQAMISLPHARVDRDPACCPCSDCGNGSFVWPSARRTREVSKPESNRPGSAQDTQIRQRPGCLVLRVVRRANLTIHERVRERLLKPDAQPRRSKSGPPTNARG